LGLHSICALIYNTRLGSYWCGTGTGVENHARYGDSIYFRDSIDAMYWILFIASELDWKAKEVKLRLTRNLMFHTSIISLETIMKVMAIGTLKPLTPEQRQKYLPAEVPATLQLYLDGKMEQFWLQDNGAGVIFLMSVDSVDEADRLLKALPLG